MGKLGAAVSLILAAVWAAPLMAQCAQGTVELRSQSGSVMRFTVEIADSAAERAQGLMNRPSMAKSAGMLFVYETPGHARFWMRNTLIPLDMIFADATGLVTHVHSNAVPMDDTSIDGGEGVALVLEINGGLAKRLGVEAGAVLRSDQVDQTVAAWACE
jgi:uncharacterized membrane protein (UPF0127 family)